jgi:hypothetical protein
VAQLLLHLVTANSVKSILFLFSILFTVSSFITANPNVDHWEFSYNDSILASGSGPKMDKVIVLHSKNFRPTDSLKFIYQPCAMHRDEYLTRVYLAYGQKQVLVSEKTSVGFEYGIFPASRLKEIFDSCNCPFVELQYLMRGTEFRSMLKLKVVD